MAIPYSGTNWQEALKACRPDIVSIATPGGARYEAITPAIEFECHVFSDKPLTTSGETAVELYQLALRRQVKTAYAASFRYAPSVLRARQWSYTERAQLESKCAARPVSVLFRHGGLLPRFNLETAVGRAGVCVWRAVWQGATRRSLHAATRSNAARRCARCAIGRVAHSPAG